MDIEFNENNIIVFDSNPQGEFFSRASVIAKEFGADRNVLNGYANNSYAVCMYDSNMLNNKIPLFVIQRNFINMSVYAFSNQDKLFYLPYLGEGPCYYSSEIIESLMPHLPNNIKRIRL